MRPHFGMVLADSVSVVARSFSAGGNTFQAPFRLLLLGVIGIGACGGDSQPREASFELVDSAGVPLVQNRAVLWDSAEAWQLSSNPVLQLGNREEESEYFFHVRRVRLRSDGGVAVLEGSTAEVRVFDQSGDRTAVFAGDGDGPGELRGPRELFVLQGDTMTAWDNRPSQSVFDPMGEFVRRRTVAVTRIREYLPDRLTVGYRGLLDGSVLAVGYARPRESVGRVRNVMLFTHASIDGSRLDSLGVVLDREWWVPTSGRGRGRTLLGPESHWAAGGAPLKIALGDNATSSIHMYSADGSLEFVTRFPDEDRSVPPDALEAAREDRRDVPMPSANLERFLADAPDPQAVPAFGGMLFDRLGYLWILPYLPDEGASAWSRAPVARILDPDGHLMGAVELPPRFRVHDVGVDRVAGVRVGDLDIEIVEIYELSRSVRRPNGSAAARTLSREVGMEQLS